MRLVEAIVAANHAAVEGRPGEAEFQTFTDCLPIAALTCIDPRLNKLFPGSLGLNSEQFVWLRNAGNVITGPTSSTVRSLAMAIYLKGAKEVAIIGHTDCQMAKIDINKLLDRMAANGVSRGAVPIPNLHEFFGLFSSEKPNVTKAVSFVRTSPVIPSKIPVHGLLIDTNTGRLEWVVNGYAASGLPLTVPGLSEDTTGHPGAAPGPVKSVGGNMPALRAEEWHSPATTPGAPVSPPASPPAATPPRRLPMPPIAQPSVKSKYAAPPPFVRVQKPKFKP
jgi:carbonic anhydrase